MKMISFLTGNFAEVLLYIIILLADIDYVGVLDYAIKAFIGSFIWFCFKLLSELFIKEKKTKEKDSDNPPASN